MSIYEHTGIRQYILDFQRLELRRLQLAARRPLDKQDPGHQNLVQVVIDHADRGYEQGIGPKDRRMAKANESQSDNIVRMHQAHLTNADFLAVDLLVSRSYASLDRLTGSICLVLGINDLLSARFYQSGSSLRFPLLYLADFCLADSRRTSGY